MHSASPAPILRRAFSLLELLIVVTIVAVLTLMAFRGYSAFIARGETAACTGKMVNFGVALRNYLTDHQTWPQEDVLNGKDGKPPEDDVLWDWWYKELKPEGLGPDDWLCPKDLRERKKEEKKAKADGKEEEGNKYENKEPSYIPSKFEAGPFAPNEYPSFPWAVERRGHAEGMNKLMPNGTIQREFNFKAVRTTNQ